MKLHSLFRYCAVAVVLMMTAGTLGLRAQSFEPFSPYGIFSPSVESYQMTRCGNLLPSLYTGAMTFSLPLMTYSDPDFTIPVTLEYSFDGYKPGQHSGTVGYGWYLDCGGVITREVRGIPDEGDLDSGINSSGCRIFGWRKAGELRGALETHSGDIYSIMKSSTDDVVPETYMAVLKSYDPFTDTPVLALRGGLGYDLYDTAPDIYHFRFLGHSGDFMMLPDGTVRVYNSDIPHGEISVEFIDDNDFPWDVTITLTTGDGYAYVFGPEGLTEIPSLPGDLPRRISKSVSGYRLLRVTAPNKRSVELHYRDQSRPLLNPRYKTSLNGGFLFQGEWINENDEGVIETGGDLSWTYIKESFSSIKRVTVHDTTGAVTGSILFFYSSPPSNENAAINFDQSDQGGFEPGPSTKVIYSIEMYGQDGIADAVTLSYIGSLSGTEKTFLRTVKGMKTGEYTFDYDLSGYILPPNNTQGTDHWGYWNGVPITDLREHLAETAWMFTPAQNPPDPIPVPGPGADTTYIYPPQNGISERREPTHLYDQMADGAKEANAAYSVCGALTCIHYPHGGSTAVKYEPNRVTRRMNVRATEVTRFLEPVDSLDTSVSSVVGGVRVRMLVDSDGRGRSDTTRFSYTDPDEGGRESGILMIMPKYTSTAQYVHSSDSQFYNYSMRGIVSMTAIGFNNCCSFVVDRDPHVVYPAVTVVHPDGSYTQHRFTSIADAGLTDSYHSLAAVPKHVLGYRDIIRYVPHAPTCMVPASTDRRNLRGKPKRTIVRDASGRELRRTEYEYASDPVTVPSLSFNNILTFNIASYYVESPMLISTVETERGVTVRTDRSYNALGQASVTSTVRGNGAAAGDTLRMRLRYRHETGDTSRFRTLPEAAARTLALGTDEYLAGALLL